MCQFESGQEHQIFIYMDYIIIFKTVILGIIEGLTEYLPVSSTAHLILLSEQLNFNEVPNMIFETSIQFGAILAVIIIYRKKIKNILLNFHKKSIEQNFVVNLIIAFMPAAVLGLLTHEFIKSNLFSSNIVAYALIFGGIVMIIIDKLNFKFATKDIFLVSKKQAIIIGIFQSIALIPGMSRSGSTIVGGLLAGLSRKSAAEFSFFLAIPTILAASLYDLIINYKILNIEHINIIATGFMTSFLVAIFVVKFFIEIIRKYGLSPFGYYRIILGLLIITYF